MTMICAKVTLLGKVRLENRNGLNIWVTKENGSLTSYLLKTVFVRNVNSGLFFKVGTRHKIRRCRNLQLTKNFKSSFFSASLKKNFGRFFFFYGESALSGHCAGQCIGNDEGIKPSAS